MSEVTPIVYVVDGDTSARESLKALIGGAGCRPMVFGSAEEFLAHPLACCPSCLILETMLPGLPGLALQQRVARDRADLPIIFVTAQRDVALAVRAMKAGAEEFLSKPVRDDLVVEAINNALNRSRVVQGAATQVRTLRQRFETLSKREREVMGLVVSGLMNKQVGATLGISEITVKAHRGNVMRKMSAGSLAELVTIAARLLTADDRASGRTLTAFRRSAKDHSPQGGAIQGHTAPGPEDQVQVLLEARTRSVTSPEPISGSGALRTSLSTNGLLSAPTARLRLLKSRSTDTSVQYPCSLASDLMMGSDVSKAGLSCLERQE